jgi:hypothetical protein
VWHRGHRGGGRAALARRPVRDGDTIAHRGPDGATLALCNQPAWPSASCPSSTSPAVAAAAQRGNPATSSSTARSTATSVEAELEPGTGPAHALRREAVLRPRGMGRRRRARLRGMFAFASGTRSGSACSSPATVWASRSYHEAGAAWPSPASGGLLADPSRPARRTWRYQYLVCQCVPAPRTFAGCAGTLTPWCSRTASRACSVTGRCPSSPPWTSLEDAGGGAARLGSGPCG